MKKLLLGTLLGIVLTGLVGVAVGYLVIVNGMIPARGDDRPSKIETWVAHKALKATLQKEGTDKSPIPADEENLMAGAKVYGSNCGGCHGTPADPSPKFAGGFNPGPTLFADGDMVTDDPEGYSYWKINHGIKFTGMPSFNQMLSEKEMWQVTLFLKHMDKLPPPVSDYWKKMK